MNVHLCVLFVLIKAVLVQALTCSCICGSNTYYPGTTCSTSSGCASACYNYYGYSLCSYYNTRGCCGTQTCVYYSSSYPSYSYSYNQCNCQCSSSSSSSAFLLGSASMSGCNATLCIQACNSLYPTTCGVYSNQAYCSNNTNPRRSETYVFMLSMIIVCLIPNKNKHF